MIFSQVFKKSKYQTKLNILYFMYKIINVIIGGEILKNVMAGECLLWFFYPKIFFLYTFSIRQLCENRPFKRHVMIHSLC